jgi:hypothetical protein
VVLVVLFFQRRVGETHGEYAVPEVVPLQQITYNAFAIQEIKTYAPKKFEVQVLNIIILSHTQK